MEMQQPLTNPVKAGSRMRKILQQKHMQAMALAGIVWMLVFCYIPMYWIIIAFKQYDIVKPLFETPWVGLQHFQEFLSDDRFFLVLRNTIGISLLKLIVSFPLPIFFAILLNEIGSLRYKRFIQTISYLPHFLSWVVLGGILTTWLSESGMINELLVQAGILQQPVTFLAEPAYFWGIVVFSDLWKELGWSAIIYLAAISGIDPQLYEAATVDGAGRFRKIWHITLPCIKGTVAVLFILAVAYLLSSNFDQIFVLMNTLNAEASDVVDIYVYRMGVTSGRFSFATAVGLFKSVLSLLLLLAANFTSKKLTGSSLY
jgi:putative aldouronate transport system permease protein